MAAPEIPEAAVEAMAASRFNREPRGGWARADDDLRKTRRALARRDLQAALPAIHADLRERLGELERFASMNYGLVGDPDGRWVRLSDVLDSIGLGEEVGR